MPWHSLVTIRPFIEAMVQDTVLACAVVVSINAATKNNIVFMEDLLLYCAGSLTIYDSLCKRLGLLLLFVSSVFYGRRRIGRACIF